jgi:TonB-linked SusC/RagA family outer membrane protein
MKKLLFTLTMLLFVVGFATAQRTITGKVTAENGDSNVGASVVLKGTTTGAITDLDGNYSLSVPKNATTLVVSFVGAKTKEVAIGSSDVIDVIMENDAAVLGEVIVTSLGISRAKKSLGYAAQDIKGENLSLARDGNVANALAGKIAGVQVLGQSGAKFGTPNIRVRGINSLSGGDPLYVVDGTPTDINQVNMDDVDNLSVLKGPAATALYGNRAASGVVIITTKRAKAGTSGFEINHSTTMDVVGLLPNYQNEYGGGYSQDWETFAYNAAVHPASWKSYDGQKIFDYSADESWGPKLDGTLHRSAFSWQPGAEFGQLTPFSPQPNNVRDFFEKPLSNNTNIAFAKATDLFSTRISYTHINTNGIIPGSNQKRDFISAKNSINLTKRFSVNLNMNYTNTNTANRPADNYGSSGGTGGAYSSAVLNGYNQTSGSFNQWFQRQLKIEDLKNYKNPDGTYRSWNIGSPTDAKPKYWDSPYTQVNESTNNQLQERLFGDFGMTYKFTDFLKGSVIARRDLDNYNGEGRIAYGTLNEGGKGGMATYSATAKETNYEALLSYNQTFNKISISGNAGGNMRNNEIRAYFQQTVGGLTTPGFYNIAASKDRPTVVNSFNKRQVNSVYANASFGYGDFLYIDVSARNDWSSTLPKANNSYFYPSVSGSLVFSEFLPKNNILTFGKIRGGYAKVGTDVGPYQINPIFTTGNPYGSNPTQFIPSRLLNDQLKPGLSESVEAGIDLKFLNNKVGIEFTTYKNDNKNQIIPLPVSPTSGFGSALINAGNIQTKGIEIHLFVNPVKTTNFDWNFDVNFDRSTSKVITLAPGLTNYQLGGPTWRTLTLNAREGEEWGLLVGKKIRLDPASGKRLVGADGHYIVDDNKALGSALPKFKGGFVNSLNYKGLVLRFNIDFIVGGKFFSTTRMFNAYAGLAAETAGLNELGKPKRDPVSAGGGILLDAVTADGKQNVTRVETQEFYEDKLFGLNDYFIYDQTFVKLREIALGYNVPKKIMGNLPIKSVYVGLLVRNPLLLYSAIDGGVDISETETFWTEGGQLPPVRSFGLNLKFGF